MSTAESAVPQPEPVPSEEDWDQDDWGDEDWGAPILSSPAVSALTLAKPGQADPLARRLVETAFLASTASLIWLVNYYFPLGPILRVCFPLPLALLYLRWGSRAAWMGAVTTSLLLAVLMGPSRGILYLMPFGLLGVLLGACWRRQLSWGPAIALSTLLGGLGTFFQLWLLGVFLGEDLWVYMTSQATNLLDWVVVQLGLFVRVQLEWVQVAATLIVFTNSLLYAGVVHLVAWLLFRRIGNPIPDPPAWLARSLDLERYD
jgi:uncharacterized protein YybS (DUF2232 family)